MSDANEMLKLAVAIALMSAFIIAWVRRMP